MQVFLVLMRCKTLFGLSHFRPLIPIITYHQVDEVGLLKPWEARFSSSFKTKFSKDLSCSNMRTTEESHRQAVMPATNRFNDFQMRF